MPDFESIESKDSKDELAEAGAELTKISKELFATSSYAVQLCEYVTGLKADDPRLFERLRAEKERIRAKYELPPREMRLRAPSEFEEALVKIAKKYGIQIRPTAEFGEFFAKHPAGGVNDSSENRVGVDINRNDRGEYIRSLGILEHELIHAMQGLLYPRMPIEIQEYEAYLGANIEKLETPESPEEQATAVEIIFSSFIGGSVDFWYAHESKRRGREVKPEWFVEDSITTG